MKKCLIILKSKESGSFDFCLFYHSYLGGLTLDWSAHALSHVGPSPTLHRFTHTILQLCHASLCRNQIPHETCFWWMIHSVMPPVTNILWTLSNIYIYLPMWDCSSSFILVGIFCLFLYSKIKPAHVLSSILDASLLNLTFPFNQCRKS